MALRNGRYSRLANGLARITIRLKIALMIIGVVSILAGLFAIFQARVILETYNELTQSAQPMLALSERTERDVRKMKLTLETLPSLSRKEDVNIVENDLIEQTKGIRQTLQELRSYDVSPDLVAQIDLQLGLAEQSSIDAVVEHGRFIDREKRLDDIISRVTQLQGSSQQILEYMAFQITSQTDQIVRLAQRKEIDLTPVQGARLAALFQGSLNLTDIGFALDLVVNTAINMRDLNSERSSKRAILLALEELQHAVVGLAQFPTSPERRQLARNLAELRELTAGDEGFFDLQQAQYASRRNVDQKGTQHLAVLDDVSEMAAGLATGSLDIVNQSSVELKRALQNLIWILGATLTISVGTMFITNSAIIERQFSRRMNSLTQSVSAISTGDLTHPIAVSGKDELGDMARALRTFKQNAEELRRSNAELEKFAYVAAHDLRSPLRAIHDLSTWTIEDEENALSAESQAYMTLLLERIDRLDRLLRDLLSYARAGEAPPEPERFNLSQLAFEQMQYADPDGRFAFRYEGTEQDIVTQLTSLEQVLGNLFNNAVRHHDTGAGKITVRSRVDGTQLFLEVEDDGPGIEPEYQTKVFELFQTLKPRDDVEGSGLGLAIIKKIIDRQEGQISLISDPEKRRGTTFKITLPLSDAQLAIAKTKDQAAA